MRRAASAAAQGEGAAHCPAELIEPRRALAEAGATVHVISAKSGTIRNAGGAWTDQEVVEDGNFVTSRKPSDIPTFNRTLITMLARRQKVA